MIEKQRITVKSVYSRLSRKNDSDFCLRMLIRNRSLMIGLCCRICKTEPFMAQNTPTIVIDMVVLTYRRSMTDAKATRSF